MRFEFDPAKSSANKAKHGIDFTEAQALWMDPDRIEIPARATNEPIPGHWEDWTHRLVGVHHIPS